MKVSVTPKTQRICARSMPGMFDTRMPLLSTLFKQTCAIVYSRPLSNGASSSNMLARGYPTGR